MPSRASAVVVWVLANALLILGSAWMVYAHIEWGFPSLLVLHMILLFVVPEDEEHPLVMCLSIKAPSIGLNQGRLLRCVLLQSHYLGIGAMFWTNREPWTPIDALYFSAATMSTVGYGDLTP